MEKCVYIKEEPLENILIKKNMTCKTLAKKVGITPVYMSNLKNENLPKYRPSGAVREKILNVLKVEFDSIFRIGDIDRTEEKKKPKNKKRVKV